MFGARGGGICAVERWIALLLQIGPVGKRVSVVIPRCMITEVTLDVCKREMLTEIGRVKTIEACGIQD